MSGEGSQNSYGHNTGEEMVVDQSHQKNTFPSSTGAPITTGDKAESTSLDILAEAEIVKWNCIDKLLQTAPKDYCLPLSYYLARYYPRRDNQQK